MPRSSNAQIAVDMYETLLNEHNWDYTKAWKGIALLLLSCDIWKNSQWQPFHDVVVYREVNDFKKGSDGPNAVLRRAGNLTSYLAEQLNLNRNKLCQSIGLYWKNPIISSLQPHNLVGHAFRSIIVHILQHFGASGLTYAEEVNPYEEFPGQEFITRSKEPRIDIVARRNNRTVALLSTRWRYRHDRVDVVEEALAYVTAARRHNPDCKLYAVIGEFSPNRLDKVLCSCPPVQAHAPLSAAIHFNPELISEGLEENGRIQHLKSLAWLIEQTSEW